MSETKESKSKEQELERLAMEELVKEAEQLKQHAEKEGPSVYRMKKRYKVNRVFLRNMIAHQTSSNRRKNAKP